MGHVHRPRAGSEFQVSDHHSNLSFELSSGYDSSYLLPQPRLAAEGELDPVKRAALFVAMNDMVVVDGVVIPFASRPQVSAISKKLKATLSGWDGTFWNLKDWYREG